MSELSELLRLAPIPSITLNRIGRIVDFNDEAVNFLRVDPAQIDGALVTLFLAVESVPDFLKHLFDAFRYPGITHICPLHVLRGDGSKQSAVLKSRLRPGEQGKEALCPCILVDPGIDSSTDLEAGRELFARNPQGMAWLDSEEKIMACNQAFASLFGFLPTQLEGCAAGSLFADWSSESVLATSLAQQSFRLQGVTRDGRIFPVEGNFLTSFRDLTGRDFLFLIRDLSEQERLERRSLRIADLERRAIGRDLHDALGQNLVGMAFLADELAAELTSEVATEANQRNADRASRIARLCRETNAISRDLVRGLVPVGLDEGGLAAALRDLAASCGSTHNIDCQASCQEVELGSETAGHLFRIAQEAVTNAVKHSGCGRIYISLRSDKSSVVLDVTDDGKGLPSTAVRRPDSRLRSIRHRCQLIGGRLKVSSVPGGGTSILVNLARHQGRVARSESPAEDTSLNGA